MVTLELFQISTSFATGCDMYYSSLSIYQLLPLRLRRSGRDITAALVSTNYLFFYLLSVLGGTGSILGGIGQYLVVLGQYWVVLIITWCYWVNEWYWSVLGGT